jgi:hypothetical protein
MSTKQNIRIAVVVLAMAVGACGQSGSSPSSDLQSQIDQAKQQRDLEQIKADIDAAKQKQAESQAATFKAQLGSIDTSNLPKGTITTDGKVAIEANYLAYAAADAAAQRIVDMLSNSVCHQNLGFYTGKDQDAVQAYLVFKQQIDGVQQTLAAKGFMDPVFLRKVPSSVLPEPSGDMANLYTFNVPVQPPPSTEGFVASTVAPADVGSAINAAIGLISLFKVDTTFNGVTVTSDDLALQALLAAKIRRKCGSDQRIFHPTYAYNTVNDSALLQQLQTLYQTADDYNQQAKNLDQFVSAPLTAAATSLGKQRDRLSALQSDLDSIAQKLKGHPSRAERTKLEKQQADDTEERQKIEKQIHKDAQASEVQASEIDVPGDIGKTIDKLSARYQDDQFTVQQRSDSLKASAKRVSDLIAAVSKLDSAGVAPLQSILHAEKLERGLENKSYLLVSKIISVGGNNINKKNAFWSTISFSGGIVAEYLLNDSSGAILESGTVECYGGRVKEGDLQNSGLNEAKRISCTPDINILEQAARASVKNPAGNSPAGSH